MDAFRNAGHRPSPGIIFEDGPSNYAQPPGIYIDADEMANPNTPFQSPYIYAEHLPENKMNQANQQGTTTEVKDIPSDKTIPGAEAFASKTNVEAPTTDAGAETTAAPEVVVEVNPSINNEESIMNNAENIIASTQPLTRSGAALRISAVLVILAAIILAAVAGVVYALPLIAALTFSAAVKLALEIALYAAVSALITFAGFKAFDIGSRIIKRVQPKVIEVKVAGETVAAV